jgi:hypothetical protein
MPKGQVTDEELASGLRGMGGLSSLSPVKRDSPFRDSRTEAKTVDVRAQKSAEAQTQPRLAGPRAEEAALPPTAASIPESRTAKPSRSEKRKAAQRKADIYSDRVTLQISPEMRDEVDDLARRLQRSKAIKGERITSNSVMRVAIQLFIDQFQMNLGETPNSESELMELVRRKSHWS